jgi:phosphatidylserine decarboxylase
VRAVSIALWRLFCDVDMTGAKETRFRSLHAAFIRELRPGARAVDPDPTVVASPCDAIVGAFGRVEAGTALQVKGMPYPIADLLGSTNEAAAFDGGWYVTLRLTAGMYHRFHAPHDLAVEQLRYISGDTWNVNPVALRRIERLFCKNERAPLTVRLDATGARVALIPIAAVLVASINFPWLDPTQNVRSQGERVVHPRTRFAKGEEMGWFEHGSTIVALAPPQLVPFRDLAEGKAIRMGEALMRFDQPPIHPLS